MDPGDTFIGPIQDMPVWNYAAALVVYVFLGYLFKSVFLNWIVGPLFLLVALYLLPMATRKVWAALRGRR